MKTIVLIDSNEMGAEYISFLRTADDLELQFKKLNAGDIVINGLGIERKTIKDFFATLREGRLFKQLRKLKQDYSRQLLLIEGRGMRYYLDNDPWFGLYIRLAAGWQIPVMHTQDAEQTATCLWRITRQDAVASAGPIRARPRNPAFEIDCVALRVLFEIPGIGITRAKALLDRFGKLDSIFAANQKELMEVSGIGKSRATAILEANESYV